MKDQTCFISYTTHTENDKAWAKWTEWVLRNKLGSKTIMQEYDFPPGCNFKTEMDNALKQADVVICILTHKYLESANCREEWTNAKSIIHIKFDDCEPPGLLTSRVYIDLYGLDQPSAKDRLIKELSKKTRPKDEPPAPFSPSDATDEEPPFPTNKTTVFDYEYSTKEAFHEFTLTLPHMLKIAQHAESFDAFEDEFGEKRARFYLEAGTGHRRQGDYNKALEWYREALTIHEKVLGMDHLHTASTYNNIAGVFHDQGDFNRAREWYCKALAIHKKVLGMEHPHTASTYNNIAGVFHDQGDFNKALELYYKALAIREKVLGMEHPHTALTYNNIALVHSDQGDFNKALQWHYKALVILGKVLGMYHTDTATTYNNIASTFSKLGDFNGALEWYNMALVIFVNVLGMDHPTTATTYNNIALVYSSQGDFNKALEWYLKSYRIILDKLGETHPNMMVLKNNMRYAYDKGGFRQPFEDWLRTSL